MKRLTNTTNYQSKLDAAKLILYFLFIMLCLGYYSAKATTYTINLAGKYTDTDIWEPHYPGNMITSTDTVVVNRHIKLDEDIIIEGLVIVNNNASITGSNNIIVNETGILINNGISIAKTFTNKGNIYNAFILEATNDFYNTGHLINNESIVVGNVLDNIGYIKGNGGQFVANNKMVNALTGVIEGRVDVCSGNFQNINGGQIDSIKMSFCGHFLFDRVMLSAKLNEKGVILKLINSNEREFDGFRIERSFDGKTYEVINISEETGNVNSQGAVIFEDLLKPNSEVNSIFYKMILIDNLGIEKSVPVLEVRDTRAMQNSVKN